MNESKPSKKRLAGAIAIVLVIAVGSTALLYYSTVFFGLNERRLLFTAKLVDVKVQSLGPDYLVFDNGELIDWNHDWTVVLNATYNVFERHVGYVFLYVNKLEIERVD